MKHFATTIRIAQQLKADKRTIALILIVPVVLLSLLYYEFHEVPASPFDRIGPTMLAILPLTMMFLITSVAMLRERTTGTLERILTTPINTINLMVSYAIVFGVLGLIQAGILCFMVLGPFNVDIAGPWPMLLVLALLDAFLGVSLGLFASALARSEFQAGPIHARLYRPPTPALRPLHPPRSDARHPRNHRPNPPHDLGG